MEYDANEKLRQDRAEERNMMIAIGKCTKNHHWDKHWNKRCDEKAEEKIVRDQYENDMEYQKLIKRRRQRKPELKSQLRSIKRFYANNQLIQDFKDGKITLTSYHSTTSIGKYYECRKEKNITTNEIVPNVEGKRKSLFRDDGPNKRKKYFESDDE